ncbi:MAG: PKD domain-containing protein [Chloroflexi bacterium]|nr:PKD domain-containing protein [Chloroflexota bacterium]
MSDQSCRQGKEWGGAVVWLLMTAALVSALLWGTSFIVKGGSSAAAASQVPLEGGISTRASVLPVVGTSVVITPTPQTIATGESAQVDIQIQNGVNLYAAEVDVRFNPAVLEVQDSVPLSPGINIQPGTFLNPASGFVVTNTANNVSGTIKYAVTLLNPAPGVTGTGTLARVTFSGKTPGTSPVTITSALLANRDGDPVANTTQNGTITVTEIVGNVDVLLTPCLTDTGKSPRHRVGEIFTETVRIKPITNQQVSGVDAFLDFEPSIKEVLGLTDGGTLGVTFGTNGYNNTLGVITYGAATFSSFPTGAFDLVHIRFRAKSDSTGSPVSFSTAEGRLTRVDNLGTDVTRFRRGCLNDIVFDVPIIVDPPLKDAMVGQVFTTAVVVNQSTGVTVNGVDVFIDYDPTKIRAEVITDGGVLDVVFGTNGFNNSVGVITYSAATFSRVITRPFTAFTIRWRASGDTMSSTTPIAFSFVPGRKTNVIYNEATIAGEHRDGAAHVTYDVPVILTSSVPTAFIGVPYVVSIVVQPTTPVFVDPPVDMVNTYINFNPSYLRVQAITPTAALPTTHVITWNNSTGTIDFSAGNHVASSRPTDTFTAAIVTFDPVTTTITTTHLGLNFAGERFTTVMDPDGNVVPGFHQDYDAAIQSGAMLVLWAQFEGTPSCAGLMPITVSIYYPAYPTLYASQVLTPVKVGKWGYNGAPILVTPPFANYDIRVDQQHSLANRVSSVVEVRAPTTIVNLGTLLEGDAVGEAGPSSGQVNIADFGKLAAVYLRTGTACGIGNADFDGSGQVNIADFGLLAKNYLKTSPQSVAPIITYSSTSAGVFGAAMETPSKKADGRPAAATPIPPAALVATRGSSDDGFHGTLMAAPPQPHTASTVDIRYLPTTQTVATSAAFTGTVRIEPNGQQVSGADTFVDFDSSRLEVVAITNGSTLGVTFSTNGYNNSVGAITYSAATFSGYPTSNFTLYDIAWRSKTVTGTAAVNFSTSETRNTTVDYLGDTSIIKDRISGTVTIVAPPTADFVGSPTSGKIPYMVTFTDTSTGTSISSWLWSFGDGVTSTLQNPPHSYNSTGVYTVSLTVSNAGGSSTKTRTSYISAQAMNAEFGSSSTQGHTPLTISFTDASTVALGSIASWYWNFGDGSTATTQSPTHTYGSAGYYTVTLTITDSLGLSDTEVKDYYISAQALHPMFTASPTSGKAPLTVAFTDTSIAEIGSIVARYWNFGNSTSTAQNPTFTYNSNGIYTVSLTITDNLGLSAINTKSSYITVTADANFIGFPTSGRVPLTVQFTDTTTGTVNSRLWSFGDGGTSTTQNPSHVYAANGIFTVSLTVTDTFGLSDKETKASYISVTPDAEFTASPTSGPIPLTVQFTNTTTSGLLPVGWDFGDGGTSTAQNPTHTYSSNGVFTVSLTTTDTFGLSDKETKTSYISATVDANFTAAPVSGTVPLTVYFTDTTSGTPTGWLWDFGDGYTSTAQSPNHVYNSSGTFTVTLTASGAGGANTETKTELITATGVNLVLQLAFQGGSSGSDRYVNPIKVTLAASPAVSYVVTTTNTGVLTLSGIQPGTYTITTAGPHALANRKTGVVVSAPATTVDMSTLKEGDANMSGQVNISDFGILAGSYLTTGSPSGCVPDFIQWAATGTWSFTRTGLYQCWADFNKSGQINISDFGLLAGSYLQTGPVAVGYESAVNTDSTAPEVVQ